VNWIHLWDLRFTRFIWLRICSSDELL
jgi:hypothetical protein